MAMLTRVCDRCGSTDVEPPSGPYDGLDGWSGGVKRQAGVIGSTVGAVVTQTLCRSCLADYGRERRAERDAEEAWRVAPRLAAAALAARISADYPSPALTVTPSTSYADEPGAGTVMLGTHGGALRLASWEEWQTVRMAYAGTQWEREDVRACLAWARTAYDGSIRRWLAGKGGPYAPPLAPGTPLHACVALLVRRQWS